MPIRFRLLPRPLIASGILLGACFVVSTPDRSAAGSASPEPCTVLTHTAPPTPNVVWGNGAATDPPCPDVPGDSALPCAIVADRWPAQPNVVWGNGAVFGPPCREDATDVNEAAGCRGPESATDWLWDDGASPLDADPFCCSDCNAQRSDVQVYVQGASSPEPARLQAIRAGNQP